MGLEPTSGAWPPPVFKTGSSSGRMTSVHFLSLPPSPFILAHRSAGSVLYRQQLPRIIRSSGHRDSVQVRGEGLEPPSPGSKPGSLPLADPRISFQDRPRPLSSLIARRPSVDPMRELNRAPTAGWSSPAWKAGTFAAGAKGTRRRKRPPLAAVPRVELPGRQSLDRFRGGCHRQLACPSFDANELRPLICRR